MEYKELVAITGIGGLFQLITTKSDGAIVRNITDKTTKFISARMHNVTPLESIEIYTTGDNVRLHDVFQKMKENEATTPPVDTKKADNEAVKKYFDAVFPDFDDERVYVSDMKKMLKWYELLKTNDLLHFEKAEEPEAETVEVEAVAEPEEPKEAPVKKARAKKVVATADGEEAPAKKTAKKKKTDTE